MYHPDTNPAISPDLFDSLTLADLQRRRSVKWAVYPPDVLPAWVAEMDVPLAPAVREALLTTGAAWGLSTVAFLVGLVYLQHGVFAPLGLRLDVLNLTPWTFTLPIPVAVLAATMGTTARTLSTLDPVSIIERR